jgi:hypothetical protein
MRLKFYIIFSFDVFLQHLRVIAINIAFSFNNRDDGELMVGIVDYTKFKNSSSKSWNALDKICWRCRCGVAKKLESF